ncbi:MAG: NAD-dependent epimerase/dehydratase family protein [Rhodospirillales bacterium]
MTTYLVTGAAGFIGGALARRLAATGARVIGVDNFSNASRASVPDGIEFIEADLAEPGIPDRLPQEIDVIMHLAGQASGENSYHEPLRDLQENAASTINMIQLGRKAGISRLVFASSISCYGEAGGTALKESDPLNPKSCYAIAKIAAENYVRMFAEEVPSVIFRLVNTYGPGQNMANMNQGMISIFLAQALKSGRVQVKGSLDRYRDFLFVEDCVDAWIAAAENDRAIGQTMNLGTGRKTTVGELLAAMKIHIPAMEWYVEGSTPGDSTGHFADTTRLREVLGFKASTTLTDGLAPFIEWARREFTA